MARRLVVVVIGLSLLLGGCSLLPQRPATDAARLSEELPRVPAVVVLDASGSMKVDDAPGPRFAAAQKAVRSLVEAVSDEHQLGLLAYGTGTGSDDAEAPQGCRDVKTVVPMGEVDKSAFVARVDGLRASGYTPIGLSLTTAAKQLPKDGPGAVVLVSDGVDTCAEEDRGPDPCEVAADLKRDHADLVVHTVAFRVADDPAAREQLSCIAEATGGLDLDAGNAGLLTTRLLAAFDPARAASSVQPSGFRGLRPGMSVDETREVAPKLPDVRLEGRVEVEYVDCTMTFDDGVLVAIAPTDDEVRTIDGVGVGTDVARAEQLYGDPESTTTREGDTVTYTADPEAGTGYRITFEPSDGDEISGTITRLVLCRCAGGGGAVLRDVQAVTFEQVPEAVTANIAGGGSQFVRADHPRLGPIWLFLSVNQDEDSSVIAFDQAGNRFWQSQPISDAYATAAFADPPSDATGNVFVRYNPGRYDGTIVLRATADGLEEIGQSARDDTGYASDFYYSELVGPGSDGQYVIRMMANDCDPSCAEGTVTETDLSWNGERYVER